jgi:hypothetical protein
MKKHHTKEKGDLGVAAIIFDLKKNGIQICLPTSEHLPFDLIAVSETGKLAKVSVKYRHYKKGAISFTLRSSWADKHGTHTNYHDKKDYDCLAFYCPDNGECYYINTSDITGKGAYIRVAESNKKTLAMLAENVKNPQVMFKNVS